MQTRQKHLTANAKSRNQAWAHLIPSIFRHNGIWGAADRAVLNKVHKRKSIKIPLFVANPEPSGFRRNHLASTASRFAWRKTNLSPGFILIWSGMATLNTEHGIIATIPLPIMQRFSGCQHTSQRNRNLMNGYHQRFGVLLHFSSPGSCMFDTRKIVISRQSLCCHSATMFVTPHPLPKPETFSLCSSTGWRAQWEMLTLLAILCLCSSSCVFTRLPVTVLVILWLGRYLVTAFL